MFYVPSLIVELRKIGELRSLFLSSLLLVMLFFPLLLPELVGFNIDQPGNGFPPTVRFPVEIWHLQFRRLSALSLLGNVGIISVIDVQREQCSLDAARSRWSRLTLPRRENAYVLRALHRFESLVADLANTEVSRACALGSALSDA